MRYKLESILSLERKKIEGLVVDLFRRKGSLDKTELCRLLGVSFPTISKVISDLQEEGIVEIRGQGESRGGRKPAIYNLDQSAIMAIGVVIGEVEIQVVLMNMKAELMASHSLPRDERMSPSQVVGSVHNAIKAIYCDYQAISSNILGVGIATSGPLDRKAGIILKREKSAFKHWEYVPICSMLSEKIELPVILENRARAGALAEQWFGIGQNIENLVFIHTEYSYGVGIISNGRLIEGKTDVTGSLDHMIIKMPRPGKYGNRIGQVKDCATINAMINQSRNALKSGRKSIMMELTNGNPDNLSFDDVCRAVLEGDELGVSIIRGGAWALGIAISNLLNVLCPQELVIGGQIVEKCPLFFDITTETARRFIYPTSDKDTINLKKSSLGKNVISIGAATQVFNRYFVGTKS